MMYMIPITPAEARKIAEHYASTSPMYLKKTEMVAVVLLRELRKFDEVCTVQAKSLEEVYERFPVVSKGLN